MSSYILCKILSFWTRVAQKLFNTLGSYSLAELILVWPFNIQNWFICSSIRNWIAYANEANIVNKDSPILYWWTLWEIDCLPDLNRAINFPVNLWQFYIQSYVWKDQKRSSWFVALQRSCYLCISHLKFPDCSPPQAWHGQCGDRFTSFLVYCGGEALEITFLTYRAMELTTQSMHNECVSFSCGIVIFTEKQQRHEIDR